MLPSEDDAEVLCDFGLTHNQAKVYLATVRLGLASVGRISKVSKVRREDVYRTLPKLEQMGLVEKILGTPSRIRAVPLEEALSTLIKAEQDKASQKMSSLVAKKEDLLKHFKANLRRPQLEEKGAQFSILSQSDQITKKGIGMMEKAQKEIDITTSKERLLRIIASHAETIRKTQRLGVKFRIITRGFDPEDSIRKVIGQYISPKANIELKFTEHPSSYYLIVDHKEALVSTSIEGSFAENPYLWTNNSSLVELMQENFEELWHTSIRAENIVTNAVAEKIPHFISQLRPTDHIIFVYQSPEAKHNVLFNYLQTGLKNDEDVAYVASEETPNQIREAMKLFGIDVEKHERKGCLHILGYEEVYIIDQKFSARRTMSIWNKLYDEAKARGRNGLRVTGEMACFFKHKMVSELVEYEQSLHRVLDLPMIAICAYNAEDLSKAYNPINLYNELARAHGTILFVGVDNKIGRIEIRRA